MLGVAKCVAHGIGLRTEWQHTGNKRFANSLELKIRDQKSEMIGSVDGNGDTGFHCLRQPNYVPICETNAAMAD